jgi:hypothetical protein
MAMTRTAATIAGLMVAVLFRRPQHIPSGQ